MEKSTKEKSQRVEVIKCLAAVSWAPNDPLSVEEIEVHPPQNGEVRVKIISCAICHTDVHGIKAALKGDSCNFPAIMGHEAAGIIESVGEGVSSFTAGDKVIPNFNPQCNDCHSCKNLASNICAALKLGSFLRHDGSSMFTCKGQNVYQFCGVSSFSQYIVISENNCTKIQDDAPLDKVCLLSCGIPTGYGAAVNTAKVTPGSTCAIWGLGTIGLAVAMGCKANGASKIIGVDINPDKKEICKTFGVTDFVNPNDHEKSIHQVILAMTGGGCDFTFECIGNVDAISSAFQSCHPGGGKCVNVGVTPEGSDLLLSPMDFLLDKTLTGCLFGGYKAKDGIPKLVKDYMDKKILVDEFITGRMPLKDINKAIDLLTKGKALRTIIDMF